MRTGSKQQIRAIVYGILRSDGDQTDEEIATNARWIYRRQSPAGIRTHLQDLADLGLVFESGQRNGAVVWSIRKPARRIAPYRVV